jgi:hypothetical protein
MQTKAIAHFLQPLTEKANWITRSYAGKAFWWRFHALRVGNAGGGLTGSLALTKGPAGPRGLDGAWFLSGDYLSGLGSPGVKLDKVAIGIDGDIDLRGFFASPPVSGRASTRFASMSV